MIIHKAKNLTSEERKALCRRPWTSDADARESVRNVCLAVKQRGDAAVRECAKRFDNVSLENFVVNEDEFDAAEESISAALMDALQTAAQNIRTFHQSHRRLEPVVETSPGVRCWRESRPIERVGLYIPAGSAPLPSTMLMLGIPAVIAGCRNIVVCSPPKAHGSVDPLVLATARMIGTEKVYKIGGAQAIAAMAYGTESIPKVEKVFGPGNRYVTAAKQLVASDPDGAAIDLLAGPSELLILADENANPTFVASDLLSQAEHDPNSQVVLVTKSADLAAKTEKEVVRLLTALPRNQVAAQALEKSFIFVVDSIAEAVDFSNEYAPEHLLINTLDPQQLVPLIQNAGSVFLGPFAPVTAGDYASGTNHTLPTGGTAKWSGGVSVETFQKSLTFQMITKDGLERLAPTLTTLAEAEGLEAHKRAVSVRLRRADPSDLKLETSNFKP